MLERLTTLLSTRVPSIVRAPVHANDAKFYWSQMTKTGLLQPAYRGIESFYRASSIRFSGAEMYALNDADFLTLQMNLEQLLTAGFQQRGVPVPQQVARHLVPDEPTNVLVHEKEHLDGLPEENVQDAIVDVYLQRDETGEIQLNGTAFYSSNSPYHGAWVASHPRSLSQKDIRIAREYAQLTNDSYFINLIELKIRKRQTH